jgi:hypothetical protein
MEIVNALAGGDEYHFNQNRKRLLVLTDVDECQFLPMPGQFIRTAVLGLPPERSEFSPERLQRVWMPVIRRAQDKQDLSSGNVVMRSLPGGTDLTFGIDLTMLRKQMEDGKKLWGGRAETCKGWRKRDAARRAARGVHLAVRCSRTSNSGKRPKSFKGARCSLAQIHHQSTKGAYKFDSKLQDWIDNQQLMYLADPDLTFVTADRRLIAKLSKSLDRHRVREFTEFANAI